MQLGVKRLLCHLLYPCGDQVETFVVPNTVANATVNVIIVRLTTSPHLMHLDVVSVHDGPKTYPHSQFCLDA